MAGLPDINPSVVVQRLGSQVGGLTAELAMRDTQLEAALERIAELEAAAEEAKTEEKPDAPKPPKA